MVSEYFLDSDIILDLLMDRTPYSEDSKVIFQLSGADQIKLYCSSIIVTNVFYIIRKTFGKEKAVESIGSLLIFCGILPVGEREIRNAYQSDFSDFEDSIQYHVAIGKPEIRAIITRNKKDYILSKIPVVSPKEFLSLFK
ncbi:PIN domain-containing protein [Algoriphagus sp. AK58]|uniref:PIN domain-containing protein n=1 Tax=Algoriphagus sp. AK58 TaxID=1406877 RepID=UPI00164EE375|nr:PIN domain-containing protein [Algoriphagus sp. AK58]MBC6367191.1 VapC toxin family PIN domain ribonuclease [Algoriphagus sp. AK58]